MRRLFARSMLWFLPVVIIPVAALLVMQYRFLRTLEQKSVSAERNWLRGAVETVSADVEERFRTAATEALSLSHVQLLSVATIGKHFRDHQVPAGRTYFAMHFDQDKYETRYYDRNGFERKPTWPEMEAVKLATVGWHVAHKWKRVATPALQVDEKDPANRVIVRPIVDESMHVVGVAGVLLDEGAAKKRISAIADGLLQQRFPSRVIAIRVGEFPLNMRRTYVMQPLEFVFTNWRIGVRDSCATPEEIAATHFRNNMMWSGGVFVVLLGALGLAGGAVARQARLSQMKSDFVSNVSHELRTPLSSIRVFGEYMRLGRVTNQEKVQQYGEYIEAEGRRLTQLINNILDFSKIESAEKKYRFCEIDVTELVEHTVSAFEVPLRDQEVAVSLKVAPPPPPLLQLDKDAIAQVLVNLLDNALKYSNGRKAIDVLIETVRDEVRIAVRDHGIGIPKSEQKKIFEKFYRVGSGLVHDVKGSGLGLSIVQHVVRAHGGRVEVESTPGEGSTFTIVLPVRTRESVAVARTEYA
ncbi:MAG TPA: HAMP domain-containing sensor histidine kinase [Thermoanaerobaculia bacterium]